MSFAQEDSISTKLNSYLRSKFAKKSNFYMPIKTIYADSAKVKDFFAMDTAAINKNLILAKLTDTRKMSSIMNIHMAKIQKRINKSMVDDKILSFYDTLNINYRKINLLDSTIKYNKDIANDESYAFRAYHIFTYQNRDNITIIDTASILYTPKTIRMVSHSTIFKKGFNFMGTTKINRDILKEELEILMEKARQQQEEQNK
jgi:hypothetical protein